MIKITHPPPPPPFNGPSYVSGFTDSIELILTSLVDDFYIRLSSTFLPPHLALACYTPHILGKISGSHYLGLCLCSTGTRLSTHPNASIFKFSTVTSDLNSADVHGDPSQVSRVAARHVILYIRWFLEEN